MNEDLTPAERRAVDLLRQHDPALGIRPGAAQRIEARLHRPAKRRRYVGPAVLAAIALSTASFAAKALFWPSPVIPEGAPVAQAPGPDAQSPAPVGPAPGSQAPGSQAPVAQGPSPVAQGPATGSQPPSPVAQGPSPVAQGPATGSQAPVAQAPAPGAQSPSPVAQSPTIGAQAPALGAQAPALGAQSPTVGAQSPTVGAQSPTLGAQVPAVAHAAPAPGAQARAPGAQVAPAGVGPPARRGTSLVEEARLLERVAQLLKKGQVAAALAGVDAYEAKYPAGVLRLEALGFRVQAFEQLGVENVTAARAEQWVAALSGLGRCSDAARFTRQPTQREAFTRALKGFCSP